MLRKLFWAVLISVLLISSLFVVLASSEQQNPDKLSSPVVLQAHLKGNSGYCVFQLGDGSLVLNSVNQSCTFLEKLDSSYHLLWTRTIRIGQNSTNLPRLLVLRDGGYLLAGLVNNQYTLVKTDSQGNVQWVRMFSSGAPINYFMSIIQTSDGGFAIAGFGEKVEEGLGWIWLAKINSSGNIQWNENLLGPVADCPSTIMQTSNGDYIISGVSYSFVPNQAFYTIIKINSNGDVLGNTTYGGYGYYFQPECNYAINTVNDGYLLAGYLWQKPAWVVKIDAQFNMQWNQTYGPNGSSITDALETKSGYLFIEFSRPNDTSVIITDKIGNQLWNLPLPGVTLPVGLEANFNSITSAKDGGYIMVGSKNQSVWLAKLNYQQNSPILLQQLLFVDIALVFSAIAIFSITRLPAVNIRRTKSYLN